jgi:hypothetical protein
MRNRAMSGTGDYIFGPNTHFLSNSPEAVAQAIKTRVALFVGEWFLDLREGLDKSLILGNNTASTRDPEIQQRILGTTGVLSLLSYVSRVDTQRNFTVAATVDTIYGAINIQQVF